MAKSLKEEVMRNRFASGSGVKTDVSGEGAKKESPPPYPANKPSKKPGKKSGPDRSNRSKQEV